MRMKPQKCGRGTEADSQLATKQAKIGDYFAPSSDVLSPISMSNCFAPLAEIANDLMEFSSPSPHLRTVTEGNEFPLPTLCGDSIEALNEVSDNLCLLIARTVAFISTELYLLHSS
ncbi:UNVERIFIED_CONTAM: hypothetical protein K2H54_002403 [Gekko kuhli]